MVLGNELHRRVLDRSALVSALVAPLVLAGILGFAFSSPPPQVVRVGVAGAGTPAERAVVAAGVGAAQLPPWVHVVDVRSTAALDRLLRDGRLQGGVELPRPLVPVAAVPLARLAAPVISPGTGKVGAGLVVVGAHATLVGAQAASAVASGIAGRLYAGELVVRTASPPVPAADRQAAVSRAAAAPSPAAVGLATVGHGRRSVLDYFAPSIAVIFLFVGAGLGTRALLVERAEGTLVRLAAAPVRPWGVVAGKMAAILATSLASILAVWAATALLFHAQWGDPLGVLLMAVGASLAMCGVAVFLTSLARDERQAFGIALVVGLVLALLGGNLLPPGALPGYLQVLSLGTPNGWALVGFGRLALEGDPASAVVGPFLVLCGIAAVFGAAASLRLRRMVEP